MFQNITVLIFKSTGSAPITLLIEKLLSFSSQVLKDLMLKEKFYLRILKLWVNDRDIFRNVVWRSPFVTIIQYNTFFELLFFNLLSNLYVDILELDCQVFSCRLDECLPQSISEFFHITLPDAIIGRSLITL